MTPTIDDQGQTYRCGAFAVREWFEGAGYSVASTAAFAWAVQQADKQQGLAFGQVAAYAKALSDELTAGIQWLGDGYLRDFATFDQAVKDGWCVVVGVAEADLKPGQSYYHYLDVFGLNGANFQIADSFHLYDGEQGQEPVARVHQAIADNWDPVLVGIAFKIAPATPPPPAAPAGVPLSREAVTVNNLSVIGDYSYLTPPNLAGIRLLVQQTKKLFGA